MGVTLGDDWEVIEDNERIKAEFKDYADGLVRHKETQFVVPPRTAKAIPIYKVKVNYYQYRLFFKQSLFRV